MARVNRLNKARNFQNAFQNVGARPEGARTADDGVDPFSRRKTRLVNYWTTNKQKGANAGELLAFPSSDPTMIPDLVRVSAGTMHLEDMQPQPVTVVPCGACDA